jgi:hypothetical protein
MTKNDTVICHICHPSSFLAEDTLVCRQTYQQNVVKKNGEDVVDLAKNVVPLQPKYRLFTN